MKMWSFLFCKWLSNLLVSVRIAERARSSVVERCPDKTEVVGPIPTARTKRERHVLSCQHTKVCQVIRELFWRYVRNRGESQGIGCCDIELAIIGEDSLLGRNF